MAGPSRAGEAAPGAFDILRIRPFLVLWLSAAVVFLGVMAQNIARTWLAFELTGSNAALGGVLLSFGVAMLVATPWGGVAADRLPKRLVMQVATLLLVLSSAWIGVATATAVVTYWMLIVAGVVQAIGFALFSPARMALLAELVPRDAVPGAVSLILVNSEVSRVVGPALAGLVIGSFTFGTEAVFLTSAVLLALGIGINLALPPGRRRVDASGRSPLGELMDGLSYVRRRPDLAALLWCGIGVTMAGLPYLAFLPAVASDLFDLGSLGYGLLSASSAVGAVLTGLTLGRRSHRGDQHRLLIVAGAVFGLALAAMAAAPSFVLAVVALVVVGGALLAFQTTSQALLLALSDIEFHGRVQGLVMLSFGAFGVAALPLGILADAIGARWTLAGMGVVVVGIVLVFAVVSRRTRAASRLLDLG
ncbi:MFS transporter [Blastococcus sp. BMG 814]|uniref:MFS transporter n=1 Tax=Blastococcus carthaginiensis TaxID=3050034 RepID=A0ABT9I8G0_9ACTN|nr:MFS transporter [Blastococcus carthaginiensis]MDP5181848.1 MFS transporter [Blastococcus carthaginiensis]